MAQFTVATFAFMVSASCGHSLGYVDDSSETEKETVRTCRAHFRIILTPEGSCGS